MTMQPVGWSQDEKKISNKKTYKFFFSWILWVGPRTMSVNLNLKLTLNLNLP